MQLQQVGIQTQNPNYSKAKSQNFGMMHTDDLAASKALSELTTGKSCDEALRLWDSAINRINTLKIKLPGKEPKDFDFYVHVAENGEFRYTLNPNEKGNGNLLFSPSLPFDKYSTKMQEKLGGKDKLEQFVIMCSEIPKKLAENILETNKKVGDFIFNKTSAQSEAKIASPANSMPEITSPAELLANRRLAHASVPIVQNEPINS